MFEPFKNNHQSKQIGELIFENQEDKVSIYGDIDIYKTQEGLEQALKLQQIVNDMIDELTTLQQQNLLQSSDKQPLSTKKKPQTSKIIDNPFS